MMSPTETMVPGKPAEPARPRRIEFTACGPTGRVSRESAFDALLIYAGGIAVRLFIKVWTRAQTRPGLEPWTGTLLIVGALVAVGLIVLLFRRLIGRGDHWVVFLAGGVAFVSFFRFDKTPLAAGTVLEKPLILLPLIPAAIAAWAFAKMVRSADELQRRILYQALSIGFVVTFAATLAYSVLEDLGLPHVSAAYWWVVLVLSWITGLAISSRRYQ